LIFRPGPIFGKKFWQEAKEGSDLLTWEPVFADISSAGEIGYTTGPWEFRSKRNDSTAVATGYFVSVWKKENDQWKVALDMGVSFPPTSLKEPLNFPVQGKGVVNQNGSGIMLKDLMTREWEFIWAQHENWRMAIDNFSTSGARLYRPGHFPYIDDESKKRLFAETDKKYSYDPIGGSVSSSGDLGYVYGKVTVVTNDADDANGNYLRIWRKQTSTWKIVLDVVNMPR
jgi:ketosteroid isomerase-like protein